MRLRKIKSIGDFGGNINFNQHSLYELTINPTFEEDMEIIDEPPVRPIGIIENFGKKL